MFRQTIQLTENLGCLLVVSRVFTWRWNVFLELARSLRSSERTYIAIRERCLCLSLRERRDGAAVYVRSMKEKKKKIPPLVRGKVVSFRRYTVAPSRWYVIREPS